MTLQDFNKRYKYKTDLKNHERTEHWTIMEPTPTGLYYGDCEDYVLTLIDKVDGFADLELWYCKIGSDGHCIGRALEGTFIDCNFKQLVDIEVLKRSGFNSFRKYWKIEVWFKKVQARVQSLLRGE